MVVAGTVSADFVFKNKHRGDISPDNLVSVVRLSKYLVEDQFVPRVCLVVYVPVERACGFQDTVDFFEDGDGLVEICHLFPGADVPHPVEFMVRRRVCGDRQFVEIVCIAALVCVEVVAGVERRVCVDEVYACVWQFSECVYVVAMVDTVGLHGSPLNKGNASRGRVG